MPEFDATEYFGKKDLRRMDRASQLVLVATQEAVRDAGVRYDRENRSRCAVSLGTTLGGMLSGQEYHRLALRNIQRVSLLLDFPPNAIADRVAAAFQLNGPTFVFSTACASSAHAIAYGFDLIRSGKADVVIVGGVDTMAEFTLAGFGVLQTLIRNSDCIRPFDKNRKGFALGEGACSLVLETRSHADLRGATYFAKIGGYGSTSDAYHMTAPDKLGTGAASSMRTALSRAGVLIDEVDYINAHGTATRHNDLMETNAIKDTFGTHAYRIPVSSTKSMIGHTLGAAGAIELAATILAMQNEFLPPTINYLTPDPDCDLDYVQNQARQARIRTAVSNSFGFGGTNVSIVVRACPSPVT